jgi:hypothetical protein
MDYAEQLRIGREEEQKGLLEYLDELGIDIQLEPTLPNEQDPSPLDIIRGKTFNPKDKTDPIDIGLE